MSRGLSSGALIEPPYFGFMRQAVALLRRHERHLLELQPAFYEHFACSGCGLCCQRPWGISISREYYQRWEAEIDAHSSGQYRQPFLPRAAGTDRDYADIRRKPGTSECLFLLDDRRCFVQATYGEAALNDGCRAFPRYEGWFGAFLGKFMITSCPDVHELAWRMPGIRYTIGKVVESKWLEMQSRPHPLGFFQGYLWLGLGLDLVQNPRLSPIQALGRLGQVLATLPQQPSEADLETLYALALAPQPVLPAPDAAFAFARLLELFGGQPAVQDFVGEIARGWRALPQLAPAEALLLQDFLRSYLGYRLLSANYGESGDFFYPFYYALALQLNSLQWLALAYRARAGGELSREQLLRAASAVGYRYEQSSHLIGPLRRLSPAESLQGLGRMLAFDWGAA